MCVCVREREREREEINITIKRKSFLKVLKNRWGLTSLMEKKNSR